MKTTPFEAEPAMGGEGSRSVRVEVLVFEGCPHAAGALELVGDVIGRLAPGTRLRRVEVDSPEKAAALGFLGSPSIRVNGEDIEGRTTRVGGLSCRTYEGGSGLPPRWLVEAALLRALRPRGILFLCVANAARSQMAEGLARSLAPPGIEVGSAGSRPTRLHVEAAAVLAEIGIDISGQRSKGISEIPRERVDTVVTLCAEEECPVFPGRVRRVGWPLPDPAAAPGSDEQRREAFRRIRDELARRIRALFAAPPQS